MLTLFVTPVKITNEPTRTTDNKDRVSLHCRDPCKIEKADPAESFL